ncbi:MAG: hypothetical protein JNM85_08060 [Chthonomonas sp.]|nr:hypothetical protein [Chthonomonas sp.]
MKAVVLDKIASVTRNCTLRRDARLGSDIHCNEGDVLAVRILNNKSSYNQLELPSGRMSTLKAGDVIAGALGHRNALLGYAGVIPSSLAVGDTIQLLNLGGVLGTCTAYSPAVGKPFECEVLGQVLEFPVLQSRKGVPANIARVVGPLDEGLDVGEVPIIGVIGTCMNSGKTEACLAIIQQFVRRGLNVMAAKATGVSLRRDILAMEDAGASRTMIFTDLGIVTTSRSNGLGSARTMLNRLAADRPDVIVLELGDGLLGEYGVDSILADPSLRKAFRGTVLAAGDPVGAWGGVELLQARYDLCPHVITGPATDNESGTKILTRETGISGVNARQNPAELANAVINRMELARAI